MASTEVLTLLDKSMHSSLSMIEIQFFLCTIIEDKKEKRIRM
jgi:hypothetical protein